MLVRHAMQEIEFRQSALAWDREKNLAENTDSKKKLLLMAGSTALFKTLIDLINWLVKRVSRV